MAKATDPRVTKRRVTQHWTTYAGKNADGVDVYQEITAVDYVRPDFLDAYVDAARRQGKAVEVSDEPDAGPAGYDGPTSVPAHLDHPLAGQTFAATEQEA